MYDFAVVGVGPAGAQFARRATGAGYDMLALEKGEVGTPLACSGRVSTDAWEYIPDEACNCLFRNRIYGTNFRISGPDSKAYPFYKRSEISNVIDRVELDRTLADYTRGVGADAYGGHTVTTVREPDDRVRLTVSVAGETGTVQLKAKMVTGCNDPTSHVRRALDLPEPSETLHGVLAFDPDPDDGDFVDVHLMVPRFFARRIPRGDAGIEYGLVTPPGTEVDETFDALTSTYDVETEHFCSEAIPIGPPDRATTQWVFLVDNTVAQAKPFTGGGILYGTTTTDITVSTIGPDGPETLSAYESAWRDELSREIRLDHLIRRCYSFPEWLQRVGLRSPSGEIGVHMDKPSSLFSRERLKKLL